MYKKITITVYYCFMAQWGCNLPPCRACSLHPMSWPQSPPGGRWCRSRTFSLGPECWWERWRASRLQVNTTAEQQWETPPAELKQKSILHQSEQWLPLCITDSLLCRCSNALTIWRANRCRLNMLLLHSSTIIHTNKNTCNSWYDWFIPANELNTFCPVRLVSI